MPAFQNANLATTAVANPTSANVDGTMTFDVTVTNNGPDAAEFVGVGFAFDAEIANLQVAAPAGWNCDAPTVGSGTTTVECYTASIASGGVAAFQATGTVPASAADGSIALVVVANAATDDADETDNDAVAVLGVPASADLRMAVQGPTRGATSASYAGTISNLGPSVAVLGTVRVRSDVPAAAASVAMPGNWNCVANAVSTFDVSCSTADANLASGGTVPLTVTVAGAYNKSHYRLRAEVSSPTHDPNLANNVVQRRLAMPQP